MGLPSGLLIPHASPFLWAIIVPSTARDSHRVSSVASSPYVVVGILREVEVVVFVNFIVVVIVGVPNVLLH